MMKLWQTFISAAKRLLFRQGMTIPEGIKPVESFDSRRYLGRWYEIARFDHRFERGLTQVTATYLDGEKEHIQVVNRGFNEKKQRWQESRGKARFINDTDQAALEVSFFGPFYAGYNVIALDDDYQYALVCGPNRRFLWLLARTAHPRKENIDFLLHQAQRLNFDISKLIWVSDRP
ncbi:MAG: Outer membrane lipoprotein Blc [Candidatus Erwinia impunctatus]|nr:Outer membrane lipoprotein Blc [Culicoides impunctatus]